MRAVTVVETGVQILDVDIVNVPCDNPNGGSAIVFVDGSGGPYNYSWDNTVQLSDSVFGLHAGIYTVTVFDDRACTASATFDLDSITNTFNPDSVSSTVNNISCYGLYNGSITIDNISGSQYPPYDYLDLRSHQ